MKVAIAALLALLLMPAAAGAQPQLAAWDGTNPFNCQLQYAGLGPTGPDPGADPYCIDFDKRHQNVDQLGIVDFLSNEPARVAAATPKCFYFQSDHWRSELIEGNAQTATYAWDGHYFFDKARGMGGVHVTNFTINGQTADPSQVPGIPPQYAQYLGPGTGGAILYNDVPVDPACAARAQASPGSIYASQQAAASSGAPLTCASVSGRLRRRGIGPVRLREREAGVRSALGVPLDVRNGYLRYCLRGGGYLLVGERRSGTGSVGSSQDDRAVILITSRVGRLPHGKRVAVARFGGLRVWRIGRSDELVATRGGKVRWAAVYVRSAGPLRALIARSR